VKLFRADHGLFPLLDIILFSIYRGFSLSGGIDSATFGFLLDRGTAELFKISGTCRNEKVHEMKRFIPAAPRMLK